MKRMTERDGVSRREFMKQGMWGALLLAVLLRGPARAHRVRQQHGGKKRVLARGERQLQRLRSLAWSDATSKRGRS